MRQAAASDQALEPVVYSPGHTRTWNNSWRELYEGWKDAILAFAIARGLNPHSAQNVCQEAMIALLRSQHAEVAGYDSSQGSFQAWFWGVVRNRVRSERRRQAKEVLASPVVPDGQGDPEGALPEVAQPAPDFGQTEREQERQAIWVSALQRLRHKVKPENFEIYTALLDASATPEALARRHSQTVNNVYAIKHRCEALLIREARAIMKEQGHIHPQTSPEDLL